MINNYGDFKTKKVSRMGLDMYLRQKDVGQDNDDSEPLAQWRKHSSLHGLMEEIYRKKNPQFEGDFNCIASPLTKDDIYYVIEAIRLRELPDTEGFFFRGSTAEEEYNEDLLIFGNALKVVKQGKEVFYDSWW